MYFLLMIHLAVAVYVLLRAVVPLKLRVFWRIVIAVPLFIPAAALLLRSLFDKNAIWDFASAPMQAAALLYGVIFLFALMLMVADAAGIAVRLWFACVRRDPPEFGPVRRILYPALLAVAVILAIFGFRQGRALPEVRRETLYLAGLPPEADGMTVALLADIHISTPGDAERMRRIVERTEMLSPDLILLGGDFVDGPVHELADAMSPLRNLRAGYGVWAVPGNHEYYSGHGAWRRWFIDSGLPMLENSHRMLPCGIALAGVTDPVAARFKASCEAPDIEKALAGIPDGAFTILLAHRPRFADEAAGKGVALQLSGHTHGGLVWGLERLVAAFNSGFVSGAYRVEGMTLYVSRGVGLWAGFPFRIGIPPEITLLTLRRPAPR